METPLCRYMWLDGEFVPKDKARVPITTHAIHYGTTVFEGIRAYWDSDNLYVFRLEDHVRRLGRSAEIYSMSVGFSSEQIRDAIIGLCKKNRIREPAYIRPFCFIGQHGINLYVTKDSPTHLGIYMFPFGDLFDKSGIAAGISSWRKFSDASTPPQAKMGGNYLNSIIATREARQNGYDEALFLDQNGNLSEAPGENVFIVRDGHLITPPISSSALDGITRDTVIRSASDLGIGTAEREIPRSEVYLADEVFLSGTAAEITPVTSVDRIGIGGGKVGEITGRLMDTYCDIVTNRKGGRPHWLTAVY